MAAAGLQAPIGDASQGRKKTAAVLSRARAKVTGASWSLTMPTVTLDTTLNLDFLFFPKPPKAGLPVVSSPLKVTLPAFGRQKLLCRLPMIPCATAFVLLYLQFWLMDKASRVWFSLQLIVSPAPTTTSSWPGTVLLFKPLA